MRTYVGSFDERKLPVVTVEDGDRTTPLAFPGIETGPFGWGFNYKATMELAYAICYDALEGDVAHVVRVAKVYKHRLIQLSPDEGFRITKAEVLARIVAIDEALNDRTMRPASVPPF